MYTARRSIEDLGHASALMNLIGYAALTDLEGISIGNTPEGWRMELYFTLNEVPSSILSWLGKNGFDLSKDRR